jgi:hypothetical protein
MSNHWHFVVWSGSGSIALPHQAAIRQSELGCLRSQAIGIGMVASIMWNTEEMSIGLLFFQIWRLSSFSTSVETRGLGMPSLGLHAISLYTIDLAWRAEIDLPHAKKSSEKQASGCWE